MGDSHNQCSQFYTICLSACTWSRRLYFIKITTFHLTLKKVNHSLITFQLLFCKILHARSTFVSEVNICQLSPHQGKWSTGGRGGEREGAGSGGRVSWSFIGYRCVAGTLITHPIHVYSICEKAYLLIYTNHNLYPMHVFETLK